MTTSLNSTIPARDLGYQLVHNLRKRLDVGVAGGLITTVVTAIGALPANAAVVSGGVWVTNQLTGGATSQVIDIGYAADTQSTADPDAYATAIAVPATTGGFFTLDEITATSMTAKPRTVDTAVTATYTGSSTTGQVDVIINYVLL